MEINEKVSFEKIKWRLNPMPVKVKRFKTGIACIDELTSGLPYGNTIILGPPGVGKSLLAREIAKRHNSLYVCCEVLSDAPSREEYKNVNVVDYTRYIPNYERAIQELLCFIENLKPEIVVVDSVSTFLSVSRQALPESPIRYGMAELHRISDGVFPMICVSEVRGVGINSYAAGGTGVEHSCNMLIKLDHTYVKFENQAKQLNSNIGDDVYTLTVVKDKHGLASRKMYKILFENNEYKTERIL